jgi:hypothetical protein
MHTNPTAQRSVPQQFRSRPSTASEYHDLKATTRWLRSGDEYRALVPSFVMPASTGAAVDIAAASAQDASFEVAQPRRASAGQADLAVLEWRSLFAVDDVDRSRVIPNESTTLDDGLIPSDEW